MTVEPGAIHVWRISLCDAPDESLLDDNERERAAAFRSEDARRMFTASHSGLRRVLGLYESRRLEFGKGRFGKPFLIESRIRFSMAHSGDMALVAVTLDAEIGVDIERNSGRVEALKIASRFFPPEEAAAVAADPGCFFRVWTRREAYLKALGVGIRGLGLPVPPDYFVRELEVPAGYAGAVACEKAGTVSVFNEAA